MLYNFVPPIEYFCSMYQFTKNKNYEFTILHVFILTCSYTFIHRFIFFTLYTRMSLSFCFRTYFQKQHVLIHAVYFMLYILSNSIVTHRLRYPKKSFYNLILLFTILPLYKISLFWTIKLGRRGSPS